MANSPLIRPYFIWGVALGVPLDSHESCYTSSLKNIFRKVRRSSLGAQVKTHLTEWGDVVFPVLRGVTFSEIIGWFRRDLKKGLAFSL